MERSRRCRRVLLIGLVVATAITDRRWASAREPSPEPFALATSALAGARSDKVRAQAALVLGRRQESRATPYLIRALSDPSPIVRAVAAKALAEIGDPAAREPLEGATVDSDAFVRRAAIAALASYATTTSTTTTTTELSPNPGTLLVKPMGDKTHRASSQLRDDMRRFVAEELGDLKDRAAGNFAVDGAIKILGTSSTGTQIAVTCAVELILSAGPGGAIIVMSTGEASVQKQRRTFRPALLASMEQEALAHAVHGAAGELRQHMATHAR